MKRKILVVGLIISSLVFAEEFNNKNKNDVKGQGQGMEIPIGEQSNLSDAQKKELQAIFEKHHKALAPLMIATEEKDLAIKKELLADKINWAKVESILKEKAVIEGQIEVHMLKNKLEIQEKFGDVFKFEMGNIPKEKSLQKNGNFDNKKMDKQEKDMKNNNAMDKKDGMKDNNQSNEMMNLTEVQQAEMKIIKDKYQKQLNNLRLSEEEKEIAVKKEMLADKLNWERIETLMKEKSLIKGQTELLMLQERDEIKSKFGIEFMGGFDRGPQGKFSPENMETEKGKM
jgi:hypothetical protein